jgi:hypothetical protein
MVNEPLSLFGRIIAVRFGPSRDLLGREELQGVASLSQIYRPFCRAGG